MRLSIAALAVLLTVSTSGATPQEDLNAARQAFRAAKYPQAIAVLTGLLYPQAQLATPQDLAEAHLLLGVSFFETTGSGKSIDREFDKALSIDPSLSLDPLIFSDGAVQAFSERKKLVEAEFARQKEARDKALERMRLDRLIIVEKRDYLINFVPFGAGQFQNDDHGWGYFFAVSQGVTVGSSVLLFGYLYGRYNLAGSLAPEDADFVRDLQITQVALGAAGLGLMAWGIIHSLANYQEEVVVKNQEDYIDDPELRKRLRAEPKSSLRIAPTLLPHGAGAAVHWEF